MSDEDYRKPKFEEEQAVQRSSTAKEEHRKYTSVLDDHPTASSQRSDCGLSRGATHRSDSAWRRQKPTPKLAPEDDTGTSASITHWAARPTLKTSGDEDKESRCGGR
jgi:hypothetical protein